MKFSIKYSLLLLGFPLFLIDSGYSQVIGIEETIDFLNRKFQDELEFSNKKKYLRIRFFKEGKVYREDQLYPYEMNYGGIVHNSDENGVVIYCKNDREKCIVREIPHLKTVDYYSRIVIPLNSSIKSETLVEALTHLIKLYYFSDLNRTEPFE